MRHALFAITISFAVLSASVSAAVPSGISGSWYNPAQSGHGVSIEVLDDTRAIAFWYVYDPDGRPVHLYIDGRIEGSNINGTAYRASGMRFGQFDPATLNLDIWGQVELAVRSCQRMELRYRSNGPAGAAYGDGEIALTRLSQLRDLPCNPAPLLMGRYAGQFTLTQPTPEPELLAAVDEDGRLWATSTYLLGRRYVSGSLAPPVLVGMPIGDSAHVDVLALGNTGLDDEGAPGFPYLRTSNLMATVDTSGTPRIDSLEVQGNWLQSVQLTQDLAASVRMLQPVPLAALTQRQYQFATRDQFVDDTYRLSFDASGAACLRTPPQVDTCDWSGSISVRNAQTAFFDFELHPSANLPQFEGRPPLIGRGWVERSSDGAIAALVFVGRDARNGLGFVARVLGGG